MCLPIRCFVVSQLLWRALLLFMIHFLISIIFSLLSCLESQSHLLHIAIFSSPGNFMKRDSIRRTWLKNVDGQKPVSANFYLGNSLCDIPPIDRKDGYGCERYVFSKSDVEEISTNVPSQVASKTVVLGFGFVALRSLTITKIGIPLCFQEKVKEVVGIRLLDAFDKSTLTKVSFISDGDNVKKVRPISFPQGAEGHLILEAPSDVLNLCRCSKTAFDSDLSPLSITSVYINGHFIPFDRLYSPCAFFEYRISEEKATPGNKSWSSTTKEIFKHVADEIAQHSDILLLNLTDTYNNLPEKLIKMISHVSEHDQPRFLLKTDDDSFLDVNRILRELQTIDHDKLWWWSHFNDYRAVPLVGKWRELNYRSATYPPFPCGGGYVISRRTVSILAQMAPSLSMFRGEDVSLGIWLAAMNISSHKNSEASPSYKAVVMRYCEPLCGWTCKSSVFGSNLCNRVQLKVNDMFEAWETIRVKGL